MGKRKTPHVRSLSQCEEGSEAVQEAVEMLAEQLVFFGVFNHGRTCVCPAEIARAKKERSVF
jgi:hypothetical protein